MHVRGIVTQPDAHRSLMRGAKSADSLLFGEKIAQTLPW